MAVTIWTQSIASGFMTNVLMYNAGPQLVMQGHYVSNNTGTTEIDTPMFNVQYVNVTHADNIAAFQLTANSNGTYAVLFTGMTSGLSGWFEIKGY